MADDAEDQEDVEGAEGEEGEESGKKKLSPIKLAIFAGVPIILIIVGVAAAFFLGFIGGKPEEEEIAGEHEEHFIAPEEVAFYDLPEILVNLNTSGKSEVFMKLSVAIEIPKDAPIEEIDLALPRILDRFQVFLRELRHEDLAGSAGTYRLKQELLRRVRKSGISVEVNDVLIREMIIQ